MVNTSMIGEKFNLVCKRRREEKIPTEAIGRIDRLRRSKNPAVESGRLPTIVSGTPPLLCLPDRLVGGALGILVLALCAALLGEVARLHDRRANLAGRQPHGGGMPRPRHIGAVQVARIAWVAMKLIQRPQRRRLLSALPCRLSSAPGYQRSFTSHRRSDFRDKRWRPTVNLPAGLDQPRKRL